MIALANLLPLIACIAFLWVNYRSNWTSHIELATQPEWMVVKHPRVHRAFLLSRAFALFSVLVMLAHIGLRSVADASPEVTWITLGVGAALLALAGYLVREVRREGP